MAMEDLNQDSILALPDSGPVTMVNLVKLRKTGNGGTTEGWDAYIKYSNLVIKLIKELGGTVLWAGDVGTVALGSAAEGDWDYVVLVRYPSRRAFVEMMTSEAYAQANAYRTAGTEKHIILAVKETYSKLAEARA